MKDRQLADLARRGFLIRCCEAAGAAFLPSRFPDIAAASPGPQYHLQPHYREKTPVDLAALQIRAGSDPFASEVHAEAIAEILKRWTDALLRPAPDTRPIRTDLSDDFQGQSWHPVEMLAVRPETNGLTVTRCRYPPAPTLHPEAFLHEFESAMSGFSRILTAELQITRIEVRDSVIRSQLRYELVAAGPGFYREARVGQWTLDWTAGKVIRWIADDEIRSRAAQPWFAETTHRAFVGCPSLQSQLLRGADYWRSTLDGACGIDIYGHNGVTVGDIDNSGRDSVYVCQPAGLPNRLYRNRGDGTFEDVTERSGLGLLDNTACALIADFRNSGRQDVVVVRANGPLLFLNEGEGRFRLKENAFQFTNAPQGTFTGAATADYDRDGRLDIYFCLYTFYQGTDQYRSPTPYFAAENGPPNFLMHNNGDGTFRDVTAQCGLNRNNTRYSFCCAWGDSNGDGWPDLYVVNDFGRKNLYRNNGDGTFTDIAPQAGVEDIGAGMSVCWLDSQNDGRSDLYVANMWTAAGERITNEEQFQREASREIQAAYRKHAMGNSLYVNEGSAFRNGTEASHAGVGRWSWSSDAWDFDHDGHQDLYVTNGMISGPMREDLNSFFWRQVVAKSPNAAISSADYEAGWGAINELVRSGYSWSGYERNVFFANNGDGTYSDVSGAIGLDFPEDSRSFVLADFDGDGRQEMLLKNRNAPQLRMMKNIVPALAPAISFRLRGTESNRDGIGAKITIQTSAGRQTRYLQAGSGFLSQHSKEIFFGLGTGTGEISATITWPAGRVQRLEKLAMQSRVTVTEGVALPEVQSFSRVRSEPTAPLTVSEQIATEAVECWLLCPVSAPKLGQPLDGRPLLLCFSSEQVHVDGAVRVVVINPALRDTAEICATYNLLFRHIFDAHRDLPLPAAFLIDGAGQIVKVYTGAIPVEKARRDIAEIPESNEDRMKKALPFSGVQTSYEYGRNYLSLGSVFFQRGYYEASSAFFQSALKNDPASAEAYYGLGSAYLKQNENARAAECFHQAVSLTAAYPETGPNAWNNLGLLATRSGDTADAIDCFRHALQIDPNHLITLENLGNAYRQQKRWDDARAVFERALSIKPDAAEANYGIGMVYAQQDDTARAYDYLQKALGAKPDYPEALNNLGILYLRTRHPTEAVDAFEKCIQVAPEFDQSYLNLARVYAIEGDRQKARTVLTSLLAQHPEHPVAKQALAELNR